MKTLIFITLLLFSTLAARGQVVELSKADLETDGVGFSRLNWKFHPGDSLQWADPEFDDSNWISTNGPLFSPRDSLFESIWNGNAWYRTTFRVDSSASSFAFFEVNLTGASEFYLDGEKVLSFGTIGNDSTSEEAVALSGSPNVVSWKPGTVNHLAIRFSNHEVSKRTILFTRRLPGVEIDLTGISGKVYLSQAPNEDYLNKSWMGILIGLCLTIGSLGFLIFIFGVRDKPILYLSLHVLAQSFLFLFLTNSISGSLSASFTVIGVSLITPVFIGSLWLFSKAVTDAFFPKTQVYYTLFSWSIVVSVILSLVVPRDLSAMLLLGLMVLILLDALQKLVRAVWTRQSGAVVLGCGVLLFILAIIVQVNFNQLNLPLLVIFMPIPVSMSVWIAMRFTDANKNLKQKVVEVEALSESKILAEKERQALIERQNEELVVRVDERTSELKLSLEHLRATQAQLVEQEKLASLGALTAGIAHEIKNPLNFVNNFAEVGAEMADEVVEAIEGGRLVEAKEILAELKENATQITKHGRRADSIVKAMMQHARGGASERESVVVNDFLEEYANLAWHGMRARDDGFQAELKRDFDPSVGSLNVMPQELGRVVLNLLNNAFDAVRGVENAAVTISSRLEGGQVAISVSDNGPGIPEEIRDKIFEPFFTTKATGEGTGLGLSLSYDIITKGHGGTMTVERETGSGAKFLVTFPQ